MGPRIREDNGDGGELRLCKGLPSREQGMRMREYRGWDGCVGMWHRLPYLRGSHLK